MSRQKLCAVTFVLCISLTTVGQAKFTSTPLATPAEYHLRVKQFSEFIDRFNYQSDWKGNAITDDFKEKVPRDNYILYLFNLEDKRITNPNDSIYRLQCEEFVKYIVLPDNPKTINLYSGMVKVHAKTNITYLGKESSVLIEMIPEVMPDRSAKWSISRVETNLFEFVNDSIRTHFIAPNSHETNFINLRKLNRTENPIYYFSSITMDPTIMFLSEVARKKINIKNVEQIVYLIEFPEWKIWVQEFNRTSTNSGWLIGDVKKIEQ
jgi:hypothetical protein